jgi:myo-inositol-1(or 4)-monophosphatase
MRPTRWVLRSVTETGSFSADRDLLLEVVGAAAELALSFFRANAKVWTKVGNSPVTEADIAVDLMLRRELRAARPTYGYLSEESADDGSRLTAPRTFIVDPIDGTRAFVAGATDWTIPIAVVEAGRPIACALCAPAKGEIYHAEHGAGAFRDGQRIHVSDRQSLEGATLAVSKRLFEIAKIAAPTGFRSVFHASLAYRLARVADGRLDGVAIKPNAQDWDLAAADLLVHEAGGRLTNLDRSPPRYDRPTTAHGPMVAAPPQLHGELLRLTRIAAAAH